MELIAEKRQELGKKNKKIRRERKLPAVMFGKGLDSVPLTLDYQKFEKLYKQAGESTLVDLVIDTEAPVKVLITEVSTHPVTDKLLHANLHKVNLKEKITAAVPIEIVGESPVVKSGEGLLLVLLHEVEVEALPSDLPHHIQVDISGLTQVEQGIVIKDLVIDRSKVEIKDQEDDELVVKIDYPQMAEEVAEVAPVTKAELVAGVEATEQLTEEEKAAREKEKKKEEETKEE